jgi:hypothetical protein
MIFWAVELSREQTYSPASLRGADLLQFDLVVHLPLKPRDHPHQPHNLRVRPFGTDAVNQVQAGAEGFGEGAAVTRRQHRVAAAGSDEGGGGDGAEAGRKAPFGPFSASSVRRRLFPQNRDPAFAG